MFEKVFRYFGYHKNNGHKRSFAAAGINRLTNDWISSPLSVDAELRYKLRVLRTRSRDLETNEPYMRRFLSLLKTFVIGQGIQFQSKVKTGVNGTYDSVANGIIEDAWNKWGKKEFCTVTGKLSWVDVQKMVIQAVARDGEILIRKIKNFDNPFRFSLQLLDADLMDEEYNEDKLPNGNRVRMGVEVDNWDRPAAYWLFQRSPYDYPYGSTAVVGNRIRIPVEELTHLFVQERPTQTRGYPWATSVMIRMAWLKGYEEAELISSRESASKGGFIKSQKSTEPLIYDGKDSAGNLIERVEPGTAYINLPPGTEFQPYDPQHPTGNFVAFSKEILRGISSGMNLNYHMIANDLETTNYNSIRAGQNVDRDYYRELQVWTVEHLCEDIFPDWLGMGLLSGAVNLPAQKLDKLNCPKWVPRGFTYIDPQREVVAELTALQAGFTTRSKIVAEQGLDYEELLIELKHEKELEVQNGIEFVPQQTGNPKYTLQFTNPGVQKD